LRRDQAGVAALEFGLMGPVWVVLTLMMIDFGEAFYLKLRLATALTVAGQYAFVNAQVASATTVPAFLSNVQTVARTAASLAATPVITVLFNNAGDATNAANYYCVSGNSPVVYNSTGTASSSCGSSVSSGKYVSISIVGSMSTFFYADPIFGSSVTVLDTALVRFQ
jgi:Flp pilus assembly protein TadG